ncbi:MAG TPA: DUF2062 domain-containing protein [Thermohalobaculum sp.]|nr:DUF2062 domain-containing protein [Thermohalobaculum sp.]
MRESAYPRKGWWRLVGYVNKRMQRLPDTPERIALGFACGAFVSFTPLFFFHFIVAGALAWIFRGNVLAALLGTAVGNPVTFPFIATAALNLGWWMLGIDPVEDAGGFSFSWLWDNLDLIFLPYLVGGVLPGLAIAVICYIVCRPLVAAYQKRRNDRLAEQAKRRRAMAAREQEAYEMHDSEDDNV